jgi:hypothetical protein
MRDGYEEEALVEVERERDALRAGIEVALSASADDVCWLDVYRDLGKLVGRDFKPELLPRSKFLSNCERYFDALKAGKPYARDEVSEANVRLQAQVARLVRALAPLARQCPREDKLPMGSPWFISRPHREEVYGITDAQWREAKAAHDDAAAGTVAEDDGRSNLILRARLDEALRLGEACAEELAAQVASNTESAATAWFERFPRQVPDPRREARREEIARAAAGALKAIERHESAAQAQSLRYQVRCLDEPRPDLMSDANLRAAVAAIESGASLPDGWAEKFRAELLARGLAEEQP